MEANIKYGLEQKNYLKYLNPKSGNRTNVTDKIVDLVEPLQNAPKDKKLIKSMLTLIDEKTERIGIKNKEDKDRAARDERKFKRSATEILESGERTGCCDSSTLFVTMARALGIPAMQVITYNRLRPNNGSGHYYSAVYIENDWFLVDSDYYKNRSIFQYAQIKKMPLDSLRVDGPNCVWAYVDDYSNIEIDGKRINSIRDMIDIQKKVVEDIENQMKRKTKRNDNRETTQIEERKADWKIILMKK